MRALKEGGVGVMIFIFLSEKLLYFFLGLCDYWHYSDKFPKMFLQFVGYAPQPQISVINVVSNLI